MNGSLSTVTAGTDRVGRMRFVDVIAPLDIEQFLSEFWTRRAAHFQVKGRTFEDRFGWPAVNAILNSGGLTFPKVIVVRDGQEVPESSFCVGTGDARVIDPHAVLTLFEQGATFVLTRADSHWPPLRSIVHGVQDFFLEYVNANAYCSPAEVQGVDSHFDLHEVFVFQVEGAKRWKVFWPTLEAPLERFQKEDAPGQDAQPYIDVILRKGEVLYVPRGHWHYAIAEGSTSLHVTIGVKCRTGKTFVDWLASELQAQPCWRQNIPLIDSVPTGSRVSRSTPDVVWAEQLKRSLIEKLSEPDLFDRFWKSTRESVRVVGEVNLPFQLAAEALPIASLRFERPTGRRQTITETGPTTVMITSDGCDIALDGVDPNLIRQMFAAETFTVRDIQQWQLPVDMEELTNLLSAFVKSGLLLVRALER